VVAVEDQLASAEEEDLRGLVANPGPLDQMLARCASFGHGDEAEADIGVDRKRTPNGEESPVRLRAVPCLEYRRQGPAMEEGIDL